MATSVCGVPAHLQPIIALKTIVRIPDAGAEWFGPLTAILSMLPSEATDDPEFHNFRKDLPEFRFTIVVLVLTPSLL